MGNRFFGELTLPQGGRVWTLCCDMNALALVEDALDRPAFDVLKDLEEGRLRIGALRVIVRAFLARHHPDVTLDTAGDLLSADTSILNRVLRLAVPQDDEARAAGNG